ncbi:MAG: DUF4364 family protein [Ruminococcaceae bacterium]|nr:DUF4364 family protein [Oscillospiraceae bacterium]
MKHYYKIDEAFEIRIIILHTLNKAERALTPYEISHIILSSAIIDFFDIHNALDFLVKADEIYMFKSLEDKTLYALTGSGKISAQNFIGQIPLEIQGYIDECIASLFEEQKKNDMVVAKSVPISFEEYGAHLEMRDDKLSLMSLDIFAGDEKLSKKMCKNFRMYNTEIYDSIISILTRDEADADILESENEDQ